MSRDGNAALFSGAMSLSVVCDCGISDHTHLLFLYSNVRFNNAFYLMHIMC